MRRISKTTVIGSSILIIIAIIIITTTVLLTRSDEEAGLYKGAVVTNGHGCAEIGTSILRKGGNAVDAAIASLFCEGVSMPQSMGLGGGFIMTIYNRTTKESFSLNARETAPLKSKEDMFKNANESRKGGLSVAVPGELRGYWRLYNRFGGGVSWKDLVQPTIELCREGIYVTSFLENLFRSKKELLYADPILRESFIDALTNETFKEGQSVKRLRFANTLEIIANQGGDVLYNGTLAEKFIEDIKDHGGILTVEDMQKYEPQWMEAIKTNISNSQTLHSTPLPGSGSILAYILNILTHVDLKNLVDLSKYQYIVESFKFGYGARTQIGDPNFVANGSMFKLEQKIISKSFANEAFSLISENSTHQDQRYYGATFGPTEDHGTANVEVISGDGDAVSVTSTINLVFGAGFASKSTGIILNDEMDDFSSPNITNSFGLPPSPINFIKPGKRPLSSMCPSLITNENGDVILAIGAAGGSKITTAVALTIINHLWFGMDIQSAVNYKRVHHQLFPMAIMFEEHYDNDPAGKLLVNGMQKIGHNFSFVSAANGFAAVTAISRISSSLSGAFDKRRSGSISFIK